MPSSSSDTEKTRPTLSRRRLLRTTALVATGLSGCLSDASDAGETRVTERTSRQNQTASPTATATRPPTTTRDPLFVHDDLIVTNQTNERASVSFVAYSGPFTVVSEGKRMVRVTATRTPRPDEEPRWTQTLSLGPDGSDTASRRYAGIAAFDTHLRLEVRVDDGPVAVHNWRGDSDDSMGLFVDISPNGVEFTPVVA